MEWKILYEEEIFDVNGYCSMGVISNGDKCLFFNVCADKRGEVETCRVYNSIVLNENSLECKYKWTAVNDSLLLDCLNNLNGKPYCGENSPIRNIKFNK